MHKTNYIILLVLFALTVQAQSQKKKKANPDDGQIIVKDVSVTDETGAYYMSQVDIKPEFPGGSKAFSKFISSKIVLPESPTDSTLIVRCYVNFDIAEDGSVTNVKIKRDPGYGLGELVVEAVKKSPKWKPGIENGKTVRTAYTLPITLTMVGAFREDEK